MADTQQDEKMGPIAAMVFGVGWIALGIWAATSGNTVLAIGGVVLGAWMIVHGIVLRRRRRVARSKR